MLAIEFVKENQKCVIPLELLSRQRENHDCRLDLAVSGHIEIIMYYCLRPSITDHVEIYM